MRYAILSDIHANLVAFQAVLEDMETRGGFDEIWCLGDIVGYGPEPHACIKLLQQYKNMCVAGNHDYVAIGRIDIASLNSDAARACQWTARQLAIEDVDYLQNLAVKLTQGNFTLVHGSPRQPLREYLISAVDADDNFSYFDSKFCLVGHSHIPRVFRQDKNGNCFAAGIPDTMKLEQEDHRLIINPGAVGQPRDGDSRASYALYDSDVQAVHHYRVGYDIEATQKRMMECGLPVSLGLRLNYGW